MGLPLIRNAIGPHRLLEMQRGTDTIRSGHQLRGNNGYSMTDTQAEILDGYADRYPHARPKHDVLLDAARDTRLTTPFLIKGAIAHMRRQRDDDVDGPCFELLVLQQRVNREVLDSALAMLEDTDPAVRQLGTRILRELPGLDAAPYPHSPEALSCLERLVAVERDEEVLCSALAAIGWQCLPAGTDVLLRFTDDERSSVRYVVSNTLHMGSCRDGGVPEAAASALLSLACDPDEDIRWSVFYDVAEYPGLFASHHKEFKKLAHDAMQDPVEKVREEASRAYEALNQGDQGEGA